MPAKTATLSVRIPPEVKEAAERAAAADDRSVSVYVDRMLREHLFAAGFLDKSVYYAGTVPSK